LIGLSRNTSVAENGVLPRLKQALLVDSVGTTLGSVLGTSSITVYVESGVGIAAGGRTGLTAVVCGLLLLGSLMAAPLLSYIPLVATTGALVFVTVKLLPDLRELEQYDWWDFLGIGMMQIAVIISFALDRAVLVGLLVYLLRDVVQVRKVNPYLIASASLLAVGVCLQLFS
jgi:AGZA family xanthine/uracil permease-like MFS transporter